MEGGWDRDGKRKVDGSPSVGVNGGGGMGQMNGGGMTREEVYGLAWGLMQGLQGWKGNGKGGMGKGGEYHPDLDEKHFRRVDKFKGDKEKYKNVRGIDGDWGGEHEVAEGVERSYERLQGAG